MVARHSRPADTPCAQPIDGSPRTSAGIKVRLVCLLQTLTAMHTAASRPRVSSVRPLASTSRLIPAMPVASAKDRLPPARRSEENSGCRHTNAKTATLGANAVTRRVEGGGEQHQRSRDQKQVHRPDRVDRLQRMVFQRTPDGQRHDVGERRLLRLIQPRRGRRWSTRARGRRRRGPGLGEDSAPH